MVSFPVVLHMVKELVQYIWMMCLVLVVNHLSLTVLTLVVITVVTVKMFLSNANVKCYRYVQYCRAGSEATDLVA